MKKSSNPFVTDGVWTFGKPNKNRIPVMIKVNPKRPKLPKYVQIRKLKSGEISYYWCPPFWARKNSFEIKTKALGRNWEHVLKMSKQYNQQLDQWRKKRKRNF